MLMIWSYVQLHAKDTQEKSKGKREEKKVVLIMCDVL